MSLLALALVLAVLEPPPHRAVRAPAVTATLSAAARRVYVVTSGGVRGFGLGDDGALVPLPGRAGVGTTLPFSGDRQITLRFHPSGRFAYAATISDREYGATLWRFGVSAEDGALHVKGRMKLEPALAQIVVHPSGRLLFAVAERGSVLPYRIDARTGDLTPLPPRAVAETFTVDQDDFAGGGGCDLRLDPAGRFAYLSTSRYYYAQYRLTLRRYRVSVADGSLTAVGAPVDYGTTQDGVMTQGGMVGIGPPLFAPGGRLAYTKGRLDGVGVFRVGPRTGSLHPVRGLAPPRIDAFVPRPPAERPGLAALDPRARFLYLEGSDWEPVPRTGKGPPRRDPVHYLESWRVGPGGRLRRTGRVYEGRGGVALAPAPGGRLVLRALLLEAPDPKTGGTRTVGTRLRVYRVSPAGQLIPASFRDVPGAATGVVFAP